MVYHYRGAYLNAVQHPHAHIYLWTLPLFHCNGWCFAWTVAARAGVNVCLRKFDPKTVFDLIRAEGVTHCGAPIVQSALANAPAELRAGITHTVRTMVAGAAPAPAVIAKMKEIGFELTHVYGLTEVYGPAAVCARQASWDALEDEERALLNARQGVRYHLQAGVSVRDPETMLEVPADEQTVGEIMFRGNICMKGYLKNERATEDAFAGGWFHRRPGRDDARRLHPHQDRSKDIIISGGENISSIEVEDALYRHPSVAAVAVVAMPDPGARRPAPSSSSNPAAAPPPRKSSRTASCCCPASGAARGALRRAAQDLHRQDPEIRTARGRGRHQRHRPVRPRRRSQQVRLIPTTTTYPGVPTPCRTKPPSKTCCSCSTTWRACPPWRPARLRGSHARHRPGGAGGSRALRRRGAGPLNQPADREPGAWRDGAVTTAPGFKQAFRQYAEAGWQGMNHPPNTAARACPACWARPPRKC